jgi:hypothetical protein
VRAFAEHIAKVEASGDIQVKKALINGMPPFDDVPAVEFDVPKSRMGAVIEQLLSSAEVNPNIMINGVPAVHHYNVRVIARK